MLRDGSRDLKKEKLWRRMVRGHQRSGLSVRAWCREHDLNEPAFYWWRGRLARTDQERKPGSRKSPPFAARQGQVLVPVRVSAPNANIAEGCVEIVLSGDRRVRLSGPVDRRMLADVLAVLEAPPC